MVVIFGAKKVKQKIAELEGRIAVLEEKLLVKEQIDNYIQEESHLDLLMNNREKKIEIFN